MKWLRTLILAMALPTAAAAQVAAVVEIYPEQIPVYTDHQGSEQLDELKELRTRDIQLPAAQLSNESEYGMIMVEFGFKDSAKKPVIVWVRSRDVELDEVLKVDVISDCAKKLNSDVTVTRGTRGLGDKC